ncbi:hypothetical protein RBH94_11740 [Aestuariibaculum sp. YM273]|uniref:hypothetical protein n=1 Tax=Aestuariibaculum sp. YM273 TaxID=3070659 RepID=UPI0027DB1BB2|nr:hypothetical protein [Aestuariibaculum sp. YM273]WMI64730.1 hypothetical protein RBH94_11740 [Aestuariibaculum sp. YM273]
MKKFIFLLAGLALTGFTMHATTTTNTEQVETTMYNRGYGNSFIFVENGIEFSVFRDGQFDFNILGNNSQLNVSVGSPNFNISFNSGYDYNAYVQYDEFGAIIQIENTPIYYDYFGRVSQVGHVNINYNNYGYVTRVGGLYVHYNRYNVFSHCTGYINVYNRRYVYRPWHRYYSVPARNYCVVYNRPYRQYYKPVRYKYHRPYYNNYRPRTAVANRHGNTIKRNRSYATVNRSPKNVTHVNRNAGSNRYIADNRNYGNKTVNRSSNRTYRPEGNRNNNVSRGNQAVRNNTSRNYKQNRVAEKPNRNNTRIYNKSKTNTRKPSQVVNRTVSKSKTTNNRKANVYKGSRNKPMASNTRGSSNRNNNRSTNSHNRRS